MDYEKGKKKFARREKEGAGWRDSSFSIDGVCGKEQKKESRSQKKKVPSEEKRSGTPGILLRRGI